MVLTARRQFYVGSCRMCLSAALLLAGAMTLGSRAEETTGHPTQPQRPLGPGLCGAP